jgi:hypothetical protein
MATVRNATETDFTSGNVKQYPNPFFDIASTYVPKNIKTLFKYCRSFFYTNAFLNNVVTKLSEYPITEILYDGEIGMPAKQQYNAILNEHLKIKSLLIDIGLDYFTYGNAFVATQMTPVRFLRCTQCNEKMQFDKLKKIKLKKYVIHGTCPLCKVSEAKFEIEDTYPKNVKHLKFIRYSPESIDVDYNPITSDVSYYYAIPGKIKSKITKADKKILKTIPKVFLDSLRENKKIELDNANFFHFKRPTLAEEDMGWGKPIILPALKEIYYLQMLKKGNEAIAHEHVVPKKSIFPANTTQLDPFTQMNLGKWRSKMEEQVKKWKRDPNHIGIFPIPIGYQELGGNARALLLTPEMKFLEETIINSLGVPIEFIKGGTTWTGSSISLRIVENHFLTYRELLLDFLNHFIVSKIRANLGYPDVKLKFKKFKMSDDAEAKQLAINLNATGKLSDSNLLDEFGYDSEVEADEISKSRKEYFRNVVDEAKAQAEAQGEAAVIMAKHQVRAQDAADKEQIKIQTELFQNELASEHGSIPEDPTTLIDRYANEIMMYPEPQQKSVLEQLAKKMPKTAGLVMNRMQTIELRIMQSAMPMLEDAVGGLPPEQGAPTKAVTKKDEVKVSGEKHKGKTKGQA